MVPDALVASLATVFTTTIHQGDRCGVSQSQGFMATAGTSNLLARTIWQSGVGDGNSPDIMAIAISVINDKVEITTSQRVDRGGYVIDNRYS